MRLCSGKLDSGTEAHSTDPNGMPYVRQVLHGRLTAAVARSPHRCCCRYTPIPNPKPPNLYRYTVELQAKSKPAQAELGSDWHAVHQVGASQQS